MNFFLNRSKKNYQKKFPARILQDVGCLKSMEKSIHGTGNMVLLFFFTIPSLTFHSLTLHLPRAAVLVEHHSLTASAEKALSWVLDIKAIAT